MKKFMFHIGLFILFNSILLLNAIQVEDLNCLSIDFNYFHVINEKQESTFLRLSISWNLKYFNCFNSSINKAVPSFKCQDTVTNKSCALVSLTNDFICSQFNFERGSILSYQDYLVNTSNQFDLSLNNLCWYKSFGQNYSYNYMYRVSMNNSYEFQFQYITNGYPYMFRTFVNQMFQYLKGKYCSGYSCLPSGFEQVEQENLVLFNITNCNYYQLNQPIKNGYQLIKAKKQYFPYNYYYYANSDITKSLQQPYSNYVLINVDSSKYSCMNNDERFNMNSDFTLLSIYPIVEKLEFDQQNIFKINFKMTWSSFNDLSKLKHLDLLLGKIWCVDCEFVNRNYLTIDKISNQSTIWSIEAHINLTSYKFFKSFMIRYYPFDLIQLYYNSAYPITYTISPEFFSNLNLVNKHIDLMSNSSSLNLKTNKTHKVNIFNITEFNLASNNSLKVKCGEFNVYSIFKTRLFGYNGLILNSSNCDFIFNFKEKINLILKFTISFGSTSIDCLKYLTLNEINNSSNYDFTPVYERSMFELWDSFSNGLRQIGYVDNFTIQINARISDLYSKAYTEPFNISDIYFECNGKIFNLTIKAEKLVFVSNKSMSYFSKNFTISSLDKNLASTYCYWAKISNFTSDKKCFNLAQLNATIKLVALSCSDLNFNSKFDCVFDFDKNISSINTQFFQIVQTEMKNEKENYLYFSYRINQTRVYIYSYYIYSNYINFNIRLNEGFVNSDQYTTNEYTLINKDSYGNDLSMYTQIEKIVDINFKQIENKLFNFKISSLAKLIKIQSIVIGTRMNQSYYQITDIDKLDFNFTKDSLINSSFLEITLVSTNSRVARSYFYENYDSQSYNISDTKLIYQIISENNQKITGQTFNQTGDILLLKTGGYIDFRVDLFTQDAINKLNEFIRFRNIKLYRQIKDAFYLNLNISNTLNMYKITPVNSYFLIRLYFGDYWYSTSSDILSLTVINASSIENVDKLTIGLELIDTNTNRADLVEFKVYFDTKINVNFLKNKFNLNELVDFDHSKNVVFDIKYQNFTQNLYGIDNKYSYFYWEFEDILKQRFYVYQNVTIDIESFDYINLTIDCLGLKKSDLNFIEKNIYDKYFKYVNFDVKFNYTLNNLNCGQVLNGTVYIYNLNKIYNFSVYFKFDSDSFIKYNRSVKYMENVNLDHTVTIYLRDFLINGKIMSLMDVSNYYKDSSLIRLRVFDNRTFWKEITPSYLYRYNEDYAVVQFRFDFKTYDTSYFWYLYINTYDYDGVNKTFFQSDIYTILTKSDYIRINFNIEPPSFTPRDFYSSWSFQDPVSQATCELRLLSYIFDSYSNYAFNFSQIKIENCFNEFNQTNLLSGVYELTINFNSTTKTGIYKKTINVINNMHNFSLIDSSSSNTFVYYFGHEYQKKEAWPQNSNFVHSLDFYSFYCSISPLNSNLSENNDFFRPCFSLFPKTSWQYSLNSMYYILYFDNNAGSSKFFSSIASEESNSIVFKIYATIKEINYTSQIFVKNITLDYKAPWIPSNQTETLNKECYSNNYPIIIDDFDKNPKINLISTNVVYKNTSLCIVNHTYFVIDASFNSRYVYQDVIYNKTAIYVSNYQWTNKIGIFSDNQDYSVNCDSKHKLLDEYYFYNNKSSNFYYNSPFASYCSLNMKTFFNLSSFDIACDSTVTKYYKAIDECGGELTYNVTVNIGPNIPSIYKTDQVVNYIRQYYSLENPSIEVSPYYLQTKYGRINIWSENNSSLYSSQFFSLNYYNSNIYKFRFFMEKLNLLPGDKYYYQIEHFLTSDQVLTGPKFDFIVPLPDLIMSQNQSNIVKENFKLSWEYDTNTLNITSYCQIFTQNELDLIEVLDCSNNSVQISTSSEGYYVLLITYWTDNQSINRTFKFTYLYDLTPPRITRFNAQSDYPSSFSLFFECIDNGDQFYQSSGQSINKCNFYYDLRLKNDLNQTKTFTQVSNQQYKFISGRYGYELFFYDVKENIYNISVYAMDLAENRAAVYSTILNVYEPPKFIYENVTTECIDFNKTFDINKPQTIQNGKLDYIKWSGDTSNFGCTVRRNWIARDIFNQYSSVTQFITVLNVFKPNFTIKSSINVDCSQIESYTKNLLYKDLNTWLINVSYCGQKYSLSIYDSFDDSSVICGSSFTRTYNLTDNCFNQFKFEQEIALSGTIEPIYPKNNEKLNQKYPYLQWPVLYNTLSIYKVYIWKKNELKPFFPIIVSSYSYSNINFDYLNPDTEYNWQVTYRTLKGKEINTPLWNFKLNPEAIIEIIDIKTPDYVYPGEYLFISYKIKNNGISLQNVQLTERINLNLDKSSDSLGQNYFYNFNLSPFETREMLTKVRINEFQSPFQTYKINIYLTINSNNIIPSYFNKLSNSYLEIRERDPYKSIELNIINYPIIIESEKVININYTVKNNYYTGADPYKWYDIIYLTYLESDNQKYIVIDKILNSKKLEVNEQFNMSINVKLPRLYGKYLLNILAQSYQYPSLNEYFDTRDTRRKYSTIEIQQDSAYYCLLDFDYFNYTKRVALNKFLYVEYKLKNIGIRTLCDYSQDLIQVYDSRSILVYSQKLINYQYLNKKQMQLKIDLNTFKIGNYTLKFYGDYLNDFTRISDSTLFKQSNHSIVLYEEPQDLYVIYQNLTQIIDIKLVLNLKFDMGNFEPNADPSITRLEILIDKFRSDNIYKETILPDSKMLNAITTNKTYSMERLLNIPTFDSSFFDVDLVLTIQIIPYKITDLNATNNNISRKFQLKKYAPEFQVVSSSVNKSLTSRVPFNLIYRCKNIGMISSNGYQWYDVIKLIPFVNNQYDYLNSIFLGQFLISNSNSEYNNEVSLKIESNLNGSYALSINPGVNFNFIDSTDYLIDVNLIEFNRYGNLVIQSFSISTKSVYSVYMNLIKISYTAKNVAYEIKNIQWFDKIDLLDKSNSVLYSKNLFINKNLLENEELSNELEIELDSIDIIKNVKFVRLTLDLFNKTNKKTNDQIMVKEINLKKNYQGITFVKNVNMNEFDSTYEPSDILSISYTTLFTSNEINLQTLYWKDSIYMYFLSNCTNRDEIIQNGILLKTLIQHEPVYEGYMFTTSIDLEIGDKLNNKKGYLYILDDINRSIFGKEQTDDIYSTWFSILNKNEIKIMEKDSIDLSIKSVNYNFLNDVDLNERYKYLIELNLVILNNGTKSTMSKDWPLTLVLYCSNRDVFKHDLTLIDTKYEDLIAEKSEFKITLRLKINIQLPAYNYSMLFKLNKDQDLLESNYENNEFLIENVPISNLNRTIDLYIKSVEYKNDLFDIEVNDKLSFLTSFGILSTNQNLKSILICLQYFILNDNNFETSSKLIKLSTDEECSVWSDLYINTIFSKLNQIIIPSDLSIGNYYLGVQLTNGQLNDTDQSNNRIIFDKKLRFTPKSKLILNQETGIESSKSTFYFKVENVQEDKSILIDIEQEKQHDLIIYASLDKIPSQIEFDFRSIRNVYKQYLSTLTIPKTFNGTYYFLIWSEIENFKVKLNPYYPKLKITNVLPNQISLNGDSTLSITGYELGSLKNFQACLNSTEDLNVTICAKSIYIIDNLQLFARFDSIRTIQTNLNLNSTDFIFSLKSSNSLELKWSQPIRVYLDKSNYKVVIDEEIYIKSRRLIPTKPARLDIIISNLDFSDGLVPVYELSSENGTIIIDKFGPETTNEQYNKAYEFLALNENFKFAYIPQQSTYKISFLIYPIDSFVTSTDIILKRVNYESNKIIFDDNNKNKYRPYYIKSDLAWNIIFDNIKECYGSSILTVYPNLIKIAERMHLYNRATRSILNLIHFGAQINDGQLLPDNLIFETDLDISNKFFKYFINNNKLSRSYSPRISDRKESGLFGFGWYFDWFDFLDQIKNEIYLKKILDGNYLRYTIKTNFDGTLESKTWYDTFNNVFKIDFIYCPNNKQRISRIQFNSTIYSNLNTYVNYYYESDCDLLVKVTNKTHTIHYKYTNEYDLKERILENAKIVFDYDTKTKMLKSISEFVNENLFDKQNFYVDCIGTLIHENVLESINMTYFYDINFKLYYLFRNDNRSNEPVIKINKKISTNEMCELVQKGENTIIKKVCTKNDQITNYDAYNNFNKLLNDDTDFIATKITNENDEDFLFNYSTDSFYRLEEVVFPDQTKIIKNYTSDYLTKYIYQDGSYSEFYSSKINLLINATRVNYDSKSTQIDLNSNIWRVNDLKNLENLITNKNGQTIIEYDVNYRPIRVEYPNRATLYYQYNSQNQRIKLTSNTGYYLEYKYDFFNRLSSLNSDKNELAKFNYNNLGYLDSIEYSNGFLTKYEYENSKLITKMISYNKNRAVFASYELTYNYDYLITRVLSLDEDRYFEYDKLSRLIRWKSINLKTNVTFEETFTYDKASNRVKQNSNKISVEYKIGLMGKLTENDQGIKYFYDKKGNLAEEQNSVKYFYDFDNHFTGFQTNETACEYNYVLDFVYEETCSNKVNKKFLVDPFGFYGYDIISIEDDTSLSFFYYGLEYGLLAQNLKESNREAILKFAHSDIYDNIASLSNTDGLIINQENTIKFDPFGNMFDTIKSESFSKFPFTYQGKFGIYELNNGQMYLFRVRAYNPSLGKFQSIDPTYFSGSQTNFYIYCDNNPINKKDTSGRSPWRIFIGLGEGIINVVSYGLSNPVDTWNVIDASSEFLKGVDLKGKVKNYIDLGAYLAKVLLTDEKFNQEEFMFKLADALLGIKTKKISEITRSFAKCGLSSIKELVKGGCSEISPENLAKNSVLACANSLYKDSIGNYYSNKKREREIDIKSNRYDDLIDYSQNQLAKKSLEMQLKNTMKKNCNKKNDTDDDKTGGEQGGNVEWPRSIDPNEIIGPIGYSDMNFLNKNKTSFDYRILFENFFNASAPARDVIVQIKIDLNYDINTIRLGPLGFGNNTLDLNYTNSILGQIFKPINQTNFLVDLIATLDYDTRVLTWKFITLDPTSLTPIEDVDIGFLPPNVNKSGIGEGFVSFRIDLNQSCDNLCNLEAQANIFFDLNAPILTNKLNYIIDNQAPILNTSTIDNETLSQITLNAFDNESGLSKIIIYMKNNQTDNYELYQTYQYLRPIDLTSLKGNLYYEFLIVAMDNVGNEIDIKNGSYVKLYKQNFTKKPNINGFLSQLIWFLIKILYKLINFFRLL